MQLRSMLLFILLGLSMTACPPLKNQKQEPAFTHQAPKIVNLSERSENCCGGGYQYVQDQVTGLCFIERNDVYRGGMAMISCEMIPTIKPIDKEEK
jgi:hypothetical protein